MSAEKPKNSAIPLTPEQAKGVVDQLEKKGATLFTELDLNMLNEYYRQQGINFKKVPFKEAIETLKDLRKKNTQ